MTRLAIGSVHGRFQPLHDGHLEYMLEAFQISDFLFVGLTQPDVFQLATSLDEHRNTRYNNPLTYFERLELLNSALVDSGVGRERFQVIPFPIERPESLHGFLSPSVPCITTILDAWSREKVRTLEGEGYVVKVLWEREVTGIRGSEIRDAIRQGRNDWMDRVPRATIEAVGRLQIRDRLLHFWDGK